MKYITLTLSLVCILSTPSTVVPSDQKGDYAIWGAGTKSCGAYTQARSEKTAEDRVLNGWFSMWVTGFITGVNFAAHDTYDVGGGTDIDGVMRWLDNYCRENPLNRTADAVGKLVSEQFPNRVRKVAK